jgi:hypothetical protein
LDIVDIGSAVVIGGAGAGFVVIRWPILDDACRRASSISYGKKKDH